MTIKGVWLRQVIRSKFGTVLGYVIIDNNGDKTAWSKTPGKIVGYYKASSNTTRTPSGKIVAYGDVVALLIPGVKDLV